ncbi:MAG: adenosylmethionine decarboxylase [Alphaproteobacteria bacterium]|nr:adenosylmethionine decarboxylase [Alphaproteobacteria bacterium]
MAKRALARIGMDLDLVDNTGRQSGLVQSLESGSQVAKKRQSKQETGSANVVKIDFSDTRLDHFVRKEGLTFAGTHLIVDLWGAKKIDDVQYIEDAFKRAVTACGATLLHINMHHFSPNNGVSGVAVLAESHISIHTWPECGYAAIDIFMCGNAQPHKAIGVLREAFSPDQVSVAEHKRGVVVE